MTKSAVKNSTRGKPPKQTAPWLEALIEVLFYR